MAMTNADPANSDTWIEYAQDLRETLEDWGVTIPRCLPGEPGACPGSAAEHVLSYLAAIKARAEFAIREMGHGSHAAPPQHAEALYQQWLDRFIAEQDAEGHRYPDPA